MYLHRIVARVVAIMTALLVLFGGHAEAKQKKRRRRTQTVEVPVGVVVAPAAYWITGAVAKDQTLHFGAMIDVYAVIDKATIEKNKDRIPKKFRKIVSKADEIRLRPLSLFIPRSLYISPKYKRTGMFGASWRPIGIGLAFTRSPRIHVSIGLIATYAFIYSDALPSPTHFLRPGLDPSLDIEFPLSDSFLISIGWASQFYIPQTLGRFGIGDLDQSVWHIGQGYLAFHFRFPYERTF